MTVREWLEENHSKITVNRMKAKLSKEELNSTHFTYDEMTNEGGERKFASLIKKGYKKYRIRCRAYGGKNPFVGRITEYLFVNDEKTKEER